MNIPVSMFLKYAKSTGTACAQASSAHKALKARIRTVRFLTDAWDVQCTGSREDEPPN